MRELNADELGYPKTTGIDEFKHGAIAHSVGQFHNRRREQGFHVRFAQSLWKPGGLLGGFQTQGRINCDPSLVQAITVEAFKARQKPLLRAWPNGSLRGHAMRQVA